MKTKRISVVLLLALFSILAHSVQGQDTIEQVIYPIDIQGHTWQLTNLALTTFTNGEDIPRAETDEAWKLAAKEGTPAWCVYHNREDYGGKYGVLYNWYAVNDERGLAPKGWWIPTKVEFDSLCKAIGCENIPIKLKAKGEWILDEGITNESGFAALPAGSRTPGGDFLDAGVLDATLATGLESTAWWTADQGNKAKAYAYVISHTGTWGLVDVKKGNGYSVRLVKAPD
ncbi:MAG: fibrobacter succinogenes major paralogous domain-containing protein [Flavobacteriales bacterium]|nr:fibrobacter succinogenes major paralogous domain-containing protein [Flavobacteriales bacterium]